MVGFAPGPGSPSRINEFFTDPSPPSPLNVQGTFVLGYQPVGVGSGAQGAGYVCCNQIVLTQQAYLQSFSVALNQTGVTAIFGIFDNSGTNGGPGNLLLQVGGNITGVASFATVALTNPLLLNAGTYWIAYC